MLSKHYWTTKAIESFIGLLLYRRRYSLWFSVVGSRPMRSSSPGERPITSVMSVYEDLGFLDSPLLTGRSFLVGHRGGNPDFRS